MAGLNSSTYSFMDVSGSLTHPFLPVPIVFQGQKGVRTLTVTMAVERTVHDVASDGAIMISAVPGHNGSITIEMQQTSALHKEFLAWYNAVYIATTLGDVADFASGAATFRAITDGAHYVARGVSPSKIPDKPYASQGQYVTWSLMCADIQQVAF